MAVAVAVIAPVIVIALVIVNDNVDLIDARGQARRSLTESATITISFPITSAATATVSNTITITYTAPITSRSTDQRVEM